MRRVLHLLLPLLYLIYLTAGEEPGRHSISANFDALHGHKHDNGNDKTASKKSANPHGRHYKRHAPKSLLFRVKRQTVTCDDTYTYRSADGTCNNLNNKLWGSVGQTYVRLLDPAYENGTNLPRLKQTDGNYLPSPRNISLQVHDFDIDRPHPRGSVMLMEWGQFLAHDIAGTPVDDGDLTEDCCSDDLVTGSSLHPDVESGGACFPIIISEGDRYFTEVSSRCKEFVRSYPVTDDNGVRQQMNELSAYIDGTNVYGVNATEMDALRSHSGGKLRVENGDDLPKSTDNYCRIKEDTDYCLEAGDSRVNVYPGLGAMHTIFLRFHNYVAEELFKVHSAYDDEKLFQEARKIVIAVLQRITYSEYLPMIIGSNAISTYGLQGTWTYDDSCDATLSNVFATAAFRFGHSMVPDALLIDGVNVSSVDLYNKPYYVLNHLDSLIEGLASQQAQRADRWYSEGITDQLFEENSQDRDGIDIAAFNIQRGRDHGLPAYTEWRDFCEEGRLASLDDMRSNRRFTRAYDDIDDVDLYSGALDEQSVGSVGATYACLLGKQFANLRNCDRFWWENEDASIGFASGRQRNQIRRTRLAHIICRTTGIAQIQQNVFRTVDANNPLQSCDSLLSTGIPDISRF